MHYGLDAGGTKIELAVFNSQFEQVKSLRVATPAKHYKQFLRTIKEMVLEADNELSVRGTVGIGLPGVCDIRNQTYLSSNVPCLTGHRLHDDLTTILDRPVAIENDCKCFALSEAVDGSGKDYERVFGAILGTGVGGGLSIGGQLYTGLNHIAGEWGHMALTAPLQKKYNLPVRTCACGLSGCCEHYISGTGLSQLHLHLTEEAVTAQEIVARMEEGCAIAVNTFEVFLDLLAAAMANLVMTYDPDAIVLGGGLSNVNAIYQKLPRILKRHLFRTIVPPVILPPDYGDASGVRGAARLGMALA
ncbi:ROK family protein [Endozoicomonas lisbonensis]|uniref:N-acetylglucosamine kinase n=1 Tax=Endozoicomonas lisbonensis TaxID=3120522 RepID=A0ABV2SAT1_9GAMM